jgi:hypothetical protein
MKGIKIYENLYNIGYYCIFCLFAITAFVASAGAMAAGYWHKLNIQQATNQEISDCIFTGEVIGSSGFGKNTKTIWKDKAKHKALKRAAELNATHIVWIDGSTGYGSGRYVSGKTFICNSSSNVNKAKASAAK